MDTRTIMDFDAQEAEVAQAMIERAELVTVLADSSKLARRGIFDVAPLSRVDRLVTDRPPPPDVAAALDRAGAEVMIDQPEQGGSRRKGTGGPCPQNSRPS